MTEVEVELRDNLHTFRLLYEERGVRIDDLEAKVERLKVALRKYGQHVPGECTAGLKYFEYEGGPCTCGLDALLEETP